MGAKQLCKSSDLVMAVPNIEGNGCTKETFCIEYEWKHPRCSTCLIYSHSLIDCPKASPKRVVNSMDKGKGQTSGADDEGFNEVKKKKSGVMMRLNLLKYETTSFLASKGLGYGPKSLWEQWRDTALDDGYDSYDDDMYEGQEIPENIQTICDNFDIKVRGRKKK
ncbi:hypothetical protein Tco_1100632 [Tanacetum coccineum]